MASDSTDLRPTSLPDPAVGGPPEETRPRVMRRRIVFLAGALAVVLVVFVFVLPSLVDWGEVWRIIRNLTLLELGVLASVTVLNVLTFAPPWMSALPGLRARQALVVTQASTASTYVAPGGPAVGMALSYAMLRGWGFESRAVALAVTLTGIWNQMMLLSFPVVALALLTLNGGSNAFLQSVALVGAVILLVALAAFALALSSEAKARSIGDFSANLATRLLRIVRRGPVTWASESLARFRVEAIGLLRRRWLPLTLATLIGQLSVFLVLLACLWALEVYPDAVGLVEAFAAWSISRLLGSIPLTPGGVGVVEVGLTSVLVAFGGPLGLVVAAVLLFRVLTIVPTLALGLLAGATWRKHMPPVTD